MQAEQFTRVARTYMDTVYRVALNYLKSPDSADDITQEVFLRLLRSNTVFESDEHIRNWLIRVTINECKRDLASRWRRVEPLEAYAEKLTFSSEENSETYRAVMDLPGKYRIVKEVLCNHTIEGYKKFYIAAEFEITDEQGATQGTTEPEVTGADGLKNLEKMGLYYEVQVDRPDNGRPYSYRERQKKETEDVAVFRLYLFCAY